MSHPPRIRPLHENDPIYVMNPPRLATSSAGSLIWIGIIVATIAFWVSIIDYGYGLFFD